MIFERDDLQLELLDVLEFNETCTNTRTKPRPFCALSLRLESDTEIDLKNETIRLKSHDLAFFPINATYIRRSRRDRMIVFHFNVQNCVTREFEVLHDFRYDTLLPLFQEARQEWVERKAGYRYRAASLLYRVFAEIHANLDRQPVRLSPPIADAVAYMTKHFSDSTLSVAGLAARAHMSETYFRRLFGAEMGVSPRHYLGELRFEHAQALLNAGYDTIASVAEKVGFRDVKNFSTAYKKRFGYPPSGQVYHA